MSWCTGACPYKAKRGCRMAAEVAKLPVDTCPVNGFDCAECTASPEPTPQQPNATVARIAYAAVSREQPSRLRTLTATHRNSPQVTAAPPAAPLSEVDFPCIHRGERLGEHVCAPCRGGRTHSVHRCNLKGRECTPLASDAMGADGQPVEYCLTCDQRQVRAREPGTYTERRIGYLRQANGNPAPEWANRFKGQSVFLVCGGPSLNQMDLTPLTQRGIMVAAVNNVAASHVRPQLWFGVDHPMKFHQSIFADPAITCFMKGDFVHGRTRRLVGTESTDGPVATSYPNVYSFSFSRTDSIKPHQFLTTDSPPWPTGPSRSVMLPALRMLCDFGFTRIYLLGCDFKMHRGLGDSEKPGSYAFDEGKSKVACESNNRKMAALDAFFSNLNPILKSEGIEVRNCTVGGMMTAFERLPFAEAVDNALREFPRVESLYGYYWRPAA